MANSFDHAAANASRRLEPLEYTFGSALWVHVSTSAYLITPPPISPTGGTDHIYTYHENIALWNDAIRSKKFYPGCRIKLEDFFLFEWFPRSPGLYFTPEGKQAREEAQHRIIGVKEGTVLYNPYGKQSMLDGGIGNIRLNPIFLNGKEWVLMSASGNGTCHQGFPVAVPLELYKQSIDEIRTRGASLRTLVGELKIVPKVLDELYYGYTGVPKLYLQVDDAKIPLQGKSRTLGDLNVSVAVSFSGEVEGSRGIFATYVSFDPSQHGEFETAIDWMADHYVEAYKGTILTDFDEQENHFREAKFSLNKVMHLVLTNRDFEAPQINIGNVLISQLIAYQENVKRQTNYSITQSNVGAVGDNAQAEHFTQLGEGEVLSRCQKRGNKKDEQV